MGGTIITIIIGYLLGSIPFGLLLARSAGLGDVRKIGSGNIGATNVLRTGNKTVAALTLACDVLKGLIPVLIGCYAFTSAAAMLGGLAALAGHIFPVWLGFKGGKGVATALGVLLGWSWPLALIVAAAWLLMFVIFRISSLSALTAAVVGVPVAFMFGMVGNPDELFVFATLWPRVLIVALVVIITHRANIARLLNGTEPRSSFSKAK
ncbi:glycerol-3-phosphate 1-O-acyltransferase PlsY [Aestuariivirga litoralis]|uniref:glycerol-3-phosphate 1-O-acyltransferase PlsY n=1 Tax=Aestuariivirga litoralis TaxID=2650924 RepID=UPI0018C53464|nr:glycerol-3-phosphate 1-O-acyltransferase PlsY [Aestuariivirga litoralis]MBG1231606.1 glycerol-3-phosphate 1-O-acyltransferase PlsY [Aestuariivirga litoralis]